MVTQTGIELLYTVQKVAELPVAWTTPSSWN